MNNPQQPTAQHNELAHLVISAIADTIRDMGPQGAPSGVIYSCLMGYGLSYAAYTELIDAFIAKGLVKQSNNVLYWQAERS